MAVFLGGGVTTQASADDGAYPPSEILEQRHSYMDFAIGAVMRAYSDCKFMAREARAVPFDPSDLISITYDQENGAITSVLLQGFSDETQLDWTGHGLAEGLTGEMRRQTIIRSRLMFDDLSYSTCEAQIAVPTDIVSETFWYLHEEFDTIAGRFDQMRPHFHYSQCEDKVNGQDMKFDYSTQFHLYENRIGFVMEGILGEDWYGCTKFGR